MPINSLVLKVASRCNLNCSYCYMYNLGDDTYKNQPKVMKDSLVDILLLSTKEYLIENNLHYFQFIFHGGEPLLAPLSWYNSFVKKTKEVLNDFHIQFSLQTNGVLYNDKWAIGLKSLNIHVGFSWDGPKLIHDKFRVFHNGKGSYEELVKGMNVHKNHHSSLGGLSVINAEIDPLIFYENAKELGITDFTLLLPHLHHSMKDEYNFFSYSNNDITYGKWLCELFDLWWFDVSENKPNINYFNDFILLILGEKLTSESFGDGENNVLVIETNGDIETTASLKSCGNGFTKEGKNIATSKLEDSLDSELINLFVYSHQNLCDTCEKCVIKSICGGGRLNQRYSEKNNFDNPSVYCNDIKLMVVHIQNRLTEDFKEIELSELMLEKLCYDQI